MHAIKMKPIGVMRNRRRIRWWLLPVLAPLIGGTVQAQSSAVEREMHFIDRSMTATELFNQGKPAEALPIFEELIRGYSEFDTDGFAAMSYADCLAQLDRAPEAMAAYEAARRAHPELSERIDRREIEVSLTGEVDESLVAHLRMLAFGSDEDSRLATLQLGRALQKQARTLLDEAAGAFRHAAGTDGFLPDRPFLSEYATTVEGIAHDLSSLIAQMDRSAGSLRLFADLVSQGCGSFAGGRELAIKSGDVSLSGLTRDGKEVSVVVRRPVDGCREVIVNGEKVAVTPAQWQLIEYYQERIADLMLEQKGEGK